MIIGGRFTLYPNDPKRRLVLPNEIVAEGATAFIAMITQAATDVVDAGANFYVGLMEETFDLTSTLASISEPTAHPSNGYIRQAVARSAVGWPTIDTVGDITRAVTDLVTFTGSGQPYTKSISRAFLTNVASGTSGKLLAVSAPLATPRLIDGALDEMEMFYELYLR
jgi:hypothetical protein